MSITIAIIIIFSVYQYFLYRRKTLVFLHFFYLIPLHASIFFVDHNVDKIFQGLQPDSTAPVVKMVPVYLATAMMWKLRRPASVAGWETGAKIVNLYLLWSCLVTAVSAFVFESMLPIFVCSYTFPLFWLFFNCGNIHEEVKAAQTPTRFDALALQAYFVTFFVIFLFAIYYSIISGLSRSLMDSRNVGSVFASTSAIVYCVLYGSLLVQITGRKYPYAITAIVSIISLSKTAVFLLPGALLISARIFPGHFRKHRRVYGVAMLVFVGGFLYVSQQSWFADLWELWKFKFTLGDDESSLMAKAYSSRLEIYEVALDLIRRFPLGIGVGNFERFHHLGYRDPHNFVLNELVEGGVFLGIPFLFVMLVVFLRQVKRAIASTFAPFYRFPIITLSLVYFTSAGVLATTGTSELTPIYYTSFFGVALFFHLNMAMRSLEPGA